MASEQEIYDIVFQVLNEQKVRDATQEVKRLEQGIAKLNAELSSGKISSIEFEVASSQLARNLATARASLEQATKSSKDFQSQLQKLGYIADDVQYVFQSGMGLRPIVNNLMQMSPILGGVALAIDIMYRNWDTISQLWGQGGTKTEAEMMEELGKKTEKTAEETAKLLKYERERAAIKAQQGPSEAQSAQATAVNKGVTEAGRENVLKGLIGLNRTRFENAPEASVEAAARDKAKVELDRLVEARRNPVEGMPLPGQRDITQAMTVLNTAQAKLDLKVREQAERDLARAATDPSFLEGMLNTATQSPNAFGPNGKEFLAGLVGALPANQAAIKQNPIDAARQTEAGKARNAHNERLRRIMGEMSSTLEAQEAGFSREQAGIAEQQRDRVRQAMPNMNETLQGVFAGALRAGGDPERVTQDLLKELFPAMGLTGETIGMVAKARQGAEDSLFKERLDKMFPSDLKSSQLMSPAEFGNALLRGGTEAAKKAQEQLNEARKQTILLQRMLQRGSQVATAG